MPRKASHQRDRNRDARRGREEIVRGEPHHLSQVTHGGFWRISLPVGICREADGGVECQVRRHRRRALRGVGGSEPLWIEWQKTLYPLNQVGKHQAGQAEHQ